MYIKFFQRVKGWCMLELYDINSGFYINNHQLSSNLINKNFFFVKSFIADGAVALHHFIHCPVVIPSHFLIGYTAITLGGELVCILHLFFI
jgi:hypothetical protein